MKKVIGKSTLNYDQLVTLVVKVESVLNSKPLTYLSMDDLEEPVTPSHLICGYRVLSLPNIEISDLSDPDYDLDQDEILSEPSISRLSSRSFGNAGERSTYSN